jgi:hypothetical protein
MPEYRRLKSFNLTEQDFSNMKNLADSYGVSDAAVIRLGLYKVFEENGLPVDGDTEWYGEDSATDRLADKVAIRVLEVLAARNEPRALDEETKAQYWAELLEKNKTNG